ncbi:YraN family protein [Ruminococcus sp. OA3]|uniref:YraN family protein n=1 Tax=Ruminococcus sp. OA3 TaxID=2914164 RepID=UPI001F05EAFC|nr:YraN family protein [Ruminococcus sp. OA3]MCH1983678.1 YraN family protein [Ruminococcus sp. OA3]
MNRRMLGSWYEEKAAEELKLRGYKILEKNYRCRTGEIDLVAWKDGILIFAEVKYRTTAHSGYPEEAVGLQKQRRISKAAAWYMSERRLRPETPCRFDVVAILGEEVRIYENAFEYQR